MEKGDTARAGQGLGDGMLDPVQGERSRLGREGEGRDGDGTRVDERAREDSAGKSRTGANNMRSRHAGRIMDGINYTAADRSKRWAGGNLPVGLATRGMGPAWLVVDVVVRGRGRRRGHRRRGRWPSLARVSLVGRRNCGGGGRGMVAARIAGIMKRETAGWGRRARMSLGGADCCAPRPQVAGGWDFETLPAEMVDGV